MKKIFVYFIIVSMLCVGMSGAVSSIDTTINSFSKTNIEFPTNNENQESTLKLAQTANKYLNLNENWYNNQKTITENNFKFPWIENVKTDLFEWWLNVEYDGVEKSKKIVISPSEFDEFLKNPLYMREYFFNVDQDVENDVQVKIGFYKATVLNMQDYEDTSALAIKTIIRTWFPNGTGIEDNEKDLQIWSEVRLNYGLFKPTAKSKPTKENQIFQGKFNSFITRIFERFIQNRQSKIFISFLDFINKIYEKIHYKKGNRELNKPIVPTVSDEDWVSLGLGYHSTQGNQIPQVVEKHFTFAKNNIFSPSIFQHEMFPGGTDPYQLEFGFRACTAGTTDPENAATKINFGFEFEPAVYMRTQFIPNGGYVYYHFGQDSQSSYTKLTFLANILKGSGDGIPLMTLFFDSIDSTLGRSGSWISFDLIPRGFQYKASDSFDVGIDVGVPSLFNEKVKIKGLPTEVKFEWDVTNTDLVIIPKTKFEFGLDVEASLVMNGEIDKIIVYYPRVGDYPADAPDSPFLTVGDISRSNTINAGGTIDITMGNSLGVDVSGNAGLTMSQPIGDISLYYPKADWANDPDMIFLSIPNGLPGKMITHAIIRLNVDLDNLLSPSNYIYGKVYHDYSNKIDAINILLPDPDFTEPIVSFTEIPAYGELRGQLYWGKLQGYAYSFRDSRGRPPDPITINFEYDLDGDGDNDFKLYNKLELRDGHINTRFKVAEDGYFYFDTSNNMLEDDFRFYNFKTGDSLLMSVDDISADNLQADWNIDTSGEQLQIKKLNFGGIVDTLKSFDLDIDYKGKIASLDLDWEIGEQGNFEVELSQEDDLTIDFDQLFQNETDAYKFDGEVTLSNDFGFDMEWKLDMGESSQNPGKFKVNKHHNSANIKELAIYFTIKDGSGEEAYGVDMEFINPRIYLDLEWYFDIDDIWPPYIFYWLDVEFIADYKDVKLLWTDIWPGSDDYGEHHWIEVI